MVHPHILFRPSLASEGEDTNARNGSLHGKASLGPMAHKGQKIAIPQGPHAVFQFPTNICLELACGPSGSQGSLPHKGLFPGSVKGNAGKSGNNTLSTDMKGEECGQLLTKGNSSLRLSGAHGSVLFQCERYLGSLCIFVVPSLASSSQGTMTPGSTEMSEASDPQRVNGHLALRAMNTRPQTQRLFESFCRDLPAATAGVTTGYVRNLSVGGIGNKASVNGQILTFTTGLSHLLSVQLPASIQVTTKGPTQITLYGLNKEEVSQWASRLRYHIFQKNVYAKPVLQFEGEEVSRKETRKK